MKRRERMERRAERLRGWAEKRTVAATATLNSNPEMRHDFTFVTQPGRIAERERMNNRDDRALESLHKADGMESRADGIEAAAKAAIYSDDDNACEALRERIAKLESERDAVKRFNASCRKGTPDYSIIDESSKKNFLFCVKIGQTSLGRGFPAYHSANLSGNIKRNRDRLERMEREAVSGPPLRQLLTKWAGRCATCAAEIPAGTVAYYRKPDLFCEVCNPEKTTA